MNRNPVPKKHCPKLCHRVNKISHTLNNLVNELRHGSPAAITSTFPRSPAGQRAIPPGYTKVTQTVHNINGVQEIRVGRHHTDNSEMKKVLEWDMGEEFRKPQQQYFSKIIKLKHDRKMQELQRLRNQSGQKEWERVQRSTKYKQNHDNGGSPRFNNQLIQQRTDEYKSPRNKNKSDRKQRRANQECNEEQQASYQEGSRKRSRNRRGKEDYMYRRKVITRYRDEDEASESSTDSEFSRFQL